MWTLFLNALVNGTLVEEMPLGNKTKHWARMQNVSSSKHDGGNFINVLNCVRLYFNPNGVRPRLSIVIPSPDTSKSGYVEQIFISRASSR